MKKLSKNQKTVIISVSVPIALAAILVLLLLFLPKISSNGTSASLLNSDSIEEQAVQIYNKNADDMNYFSVVNENGSFAFSRQKQTVQTTNDDGETVSVDEFFWTSEDLKSVPQDDDLVRGFITNMATLSAVSVVEENASDFAKYGLETPISTLTAEFDDGTELVMLFGIRNPANELTMYFRESDSSTVYLINYYTAVNVLYDVRKFANLTITPSYSSEMGNELEYLYISRSDFGEDFLWIEYIQKPEIPDTDEDFDIFTLNSHIFTLPFTAEIDPSGRNSSYGGKSICYGIYGLKMDACEYLDDSIENLRACGLDNPFATVEACYDGQVYQLCFSELDAERDVYYVYSLVYPGIYSISADKAPWCTFQIEDMLSEHPITPYIYAIDNVEITINLIKYTFDIDSETKTFSLNGEPIDSDAFRGLYRLLVADFGEEVYMEQYDADSFPEISVEFNYTDDYIELCGRTSDTVDFYSDGSGKGIVNINGVTLFKVNYQYVSTLMETVFAFENADEVDITD